MHENSVSAIGFTRREVWADFQDFWSNLTYFCKNCREFGKYNVLAMTCVGYDMANNLTRSSLTPKVLSENQWQLHWLSVENGSTHFQPVMQLYLRVKKIKNTRGIGTVLLLGAWNFTIRSLNRNTFLYVGNLYWWNAPYYAFDFAPTVGRWWPNVKGLRRWEFLSLAVAGTNEPEKVLKLDQQWPGIFG